MTRSLLRGRILTFDRAPEGPEDTGAFTYIEDAGVLVRNGRIEAVGDWAGVAAEAPDAPVTDHRPHLILPGFIDPHVHFPQTQVIASWGAKLLDWLNTYTFPEEARYGDPELAARMAVRFFDLLLAHGTTTAAAFCSVHPESAEAFFAEAARRNMCMVGGKVMMDRNAPEGVLDTAVRGHDESAALIGRWHGRGRARYAITPRFAITSSPAQLEAAGALARAHPECLIQTHLSENHDEIALTLSLFPEARDYLDVYQAHGLVGPRTLLGHAIHLEPREIAALSETGARAVFCPTSNLFLGSGLFDWQGLSRAGVMSGVASDTGGGTSFSMLATLAGAYQVLQLRGQSLHPFQAFDLATRGNAEVLGLGNEIGRIAPGFAADLVVLDAAATPAMANRMERVETLAEELFVLQMLGDDRAVTRTYVAGVQARTRTPGHEAQG